MTIDANQPHRAVGYYPVKIGSSWKLFPRPQDLVPATAQNPARPRRGLFSRSPQRLLQTVATDQIDSHTVLPQPQHMPVRVDQPGHQSLALHIDDAGIFGWRRLSVADGGDPAIVYRHPGKSLLSVRIAVRMVNQYVCRLTVHR